MTQKTIFEFTTEIEGILEEEVNKLLPGYWDEDILTTNFLMSLTKKLSSVYVVDLRGISRVLINTFKQKGSVTETKFGDIAVIVRIIYPDGDVIEGVGYLEAKKRHKDAISFPAIKEDQLVRINTNAPRARLLLYDYSPIIGFIPSCFQREIYYRGYNGTLKMLPVTHGVALPINLALHNKNYNTKLYKFGLPFSHQLAFRYLYGQDLEFDESSLKASKGFAEDQDLSKYIISITTGPVDMVDLEGSSVNTEKFDKLK